MTDEFSDLDIGTAEWCRHVRDNFVLESHHMKILRIAGEAWSRSKQARLLLETDGIVTTDKYGSVKVHPAIAIEKDSKILFLRSVRELNLDLGAEESRPPALRDISRRGA
jgi:phage terminase small subunit